jgi:hypothetical protein
LRTLHTTDEYAEMLDQRNEGTIDEQGYFERGEEFGVEL